jgi:hypothetical protein
MGKFLLALSANLLFWAALIVAAWHFLPLPLAAISVPFHCVGMVLTTRVLDSLFLDQRRTRSPQKRVEAGRSTLPGPGSDFAVSEQQSLKEAGFTVVSLPVSRRGE